MSDDRYDKVLQELREQLQADNLSQARKTTLSVLLAIDTLNKPGDEPGGLLLYDLLNRDPHLRPEGVLVRLLGFPDGAIRPIHAVDRPKQIAVLVREDGRARAYHWDRLIVVDRRYLPKEST